MSKEIRWKQRFSNFKKAMLQLEDALDKDHYTNLELQGLIQYFEYTIELAWKTLQDIIHAKGFPEISGPKSVIRKAFAEGYINDDEGWLNMWSARLTTSHTYDEAAALAITHNIREDYSPLLTELYNRLLDEPETY